MNRLQKAKYRIEKLTSRRTGWPLATLAFYGPDRARATKLVLALIRSEGGDAEILCKLFDNDEVRARADLLEEVSDLLARHAAQRVIMTDRPIGCPHEENVDYKGRYCPDPACAYWFGRNRFTGELEQ